MPMLATLISSLSLPNHFSLNSGSKAPATVNDGSLKFNTDVSTISPVHQLQSSWVSMLMSDD